jgi:hypothetical protein
MDKVRIQEIENEAGLSSSELLEKAKELGFNVKTANSTISIDNASILIEYAVCGHLPEGFNKFKNIENNTIKDKEPIFKNPKQRTGITIIPKKNETHGPKEYTQSTKKKNNSQTKSYRNLQQKKQLSLDNDTIHEEIHILVTKITNLIMRINQNHSNYGKPIIFENTNAAPSYLVDMNKICKNQEEFANFADLLYKTLMERTKNQEDEKSKATILGKLPSQFRKKHDFVLLLDEVRHLYRHDTTHSTWKSKMSRGDIMLKLKGNKLEPESRDFKNMQFSLLREFVSYLRELDKYYSNKLRSVLK